MLKRFTNLRNKDINNIFSIKFLTKLAEMPNKPAIDLHDMIKMKYLHALRSKIQKFKHETSIDRSPKSNRSGPTLSALLSNPDGKGNNYIVKLIKIVYH